MAAIFCLIFLFFKITTASPLIGYPIPIYYETLNYLPFFYANTQFGENQYHLLINTVSDISIIPCGSCYSCITQKKYYVNPNTRICVPPEASQCNFERDFNFAFGEINADLGKIKGNIVADLISFENSNRSSVNFGCAIEERGPVSQMPVDGFLGLSGGPLNIVEQLTGTYGNVNEGFSLCLPDMRSRRGALTLGKISLPAGMIFTKITDFGGSFFNFEMEGIQVGGNIVDGPAGVILINTMVRRSYFPQDTYDALVTEINVYCSKFRISAILDQHCFKLKDDSLSVFPRLEMILMDFKILSFGPSNYLYKFGDEHVYCLNFVGTKQNFSILGAMMFQKMLLTYDKSRGQIGFLDQQDCSHFLEKNSRSKVPFIVKLAIIGVVVFVGVVGLIIFLYRQLTNYLVRDDALWPRQGEIGEGHMELSIGNQVEMGQFLPSPVANIPDVNQVESDGGSSNIPRLLGIDQASSSIGNIFGPVSPLQRSMSTFDRMESTGYASYSPDCQRSNRKRKSYS